MGIIARQSIKATVASLAGVAIGAISRLFIATKFLTEEEIGLLDVVSKSVLLLITLFMLGAPQVIKKYYAKYQLEGKERNFLYTYIIFTLCSVLVSSMLYLLLKDYLGSFYIENSPLVSDYLLLPLFCTVAYVVFHILNSISVVFHRIVVPTIFNQFISRVAGILIILLYGYWMLIDQEDFFNLYLLSFFGLPAVGTLFYVLFVIKPKILKPASWLEGIGFLKETKNYNLFLILSATSSYIVMAIDAQMIGIKLGLASAGVYGIAYYMGNVVEMPKRAIGNISFPILTKAFEVGNLKKIEGIYKESSAKQFLVSSFMFILIWVNIDQIFQIIPNGELYAGGKFVVLFIGLSKIIDMLTGINRQIIEASEYYKYNLLINTSLGVLVIVLNLIFIPLDNAIIGGINGAAFASMLAVLTSNSIAFAILYWKLGMQPFTTTTLKIIALSAMIYLAASYLQLFENPFLHIALNVVLVSIFFGVGSVLTKVIDLKKLIKWK